MRNLFYFIMPVMSFFLLSCDKEDPVASEYIANISFLESFSVNEEQEIQVTIQKNSPCQYYSKTEKNVSGNILKYNFIYKGEELRCITILGVRDTVPVIFDPSAPGQYTLNFLINGKLFETRTITVTD